MTYMTTFENKNILRESTFKTNSHLTPESVDHIEDEGLPEIGLGSGVLLPTVVADLLLLLLPPPVRGVEVQDEHVAPGHGSEEGSHLLKPPELLEDPGQGCCTGRLTESRKSQPCISQTEYWSLPRP